MLIQEPNYHHPNKAAVAAEESGTAAMKAARAAEVAARAAEEAGRDLLGDVALPAAQRPLVSGAERSEERLLRRKVVVQPRYGDSARAREVAHRHGLGTPARHEVESLIENPFPLTNRRRCGHGLAIITPGTPPTLQPARPSGNPAHRAA